METNYIILFDCFRGEIIKIKLSEKQVAELESYEDIEAFLYTLEEEYDFRVSDCHWMCCEVLRERNLGF